MILEEESEFIDELPEYSMEDKHYLMYFCLVKNRRMKFLYTCVLSFFCVFLFSQERKSIKGKVFLNEYEESVSGIYVKNKTTRYTTLTDITGNFLIPAKKGDTLVFKAYNIQDRSIIITPTMEQKGEMNIHLDVKVRNLPTVYFTPFKTYGTLELDVKRIPMMNEANKLLARLGNLFPAQKMDGSTDVESETAKQSTVKIGIDGIFDAISGDARRKERLSEYEEQVNAIKNMREYFGDDYFVGIGLDKEDIDEFILYTYLNHDVKFFYEHRNYFQVLNAFDKNVLAYKSRKQQSPVSKNPKVGEKYFSE